MNALERSAQLLEESKKRRSCRKFLPEDVDMEVIRNCIRTAATAPSGADMQPWHFVVVRDPEVRQELRRRAEEVERQFYAEKISDEWRKDLKKLAVNAEKPFLTEAPCLIVIFKELYRVTPDGRKLANYYVGESVGIATGLLMNALRDAGYDMLTYTPAPTTFLGEMFHRPEGEVAEMVLVVGKADPTYDYPVLKKKTLEEIAEFF